MLKKEIQREVLRNPMFASAIVSELNSSIECMEHLILFDMKEFDFITDGNETITEGFNFNHQYFNFTKEGIVSYSEEQAKERVAKEINELMANIMKYKKILKKANLI